MEVGGTVHAGQCSIQRSFKRRIAQGGCGQRPNRATRQLGQHMVKAGGHFVARHHLPAKHLLPPGVLRMQRIVENMHGDGFSRVV